MVSPFVVLALFQRAYLFDTHAICRRFEADLQPRKRSPALGSDCFTHLGFRRRSLVDPFRTKGTVWEGVRSEIDENRRSHHRFQSPGKDAALPGVFAEETVGPHLQDSIALEVFLTDDGSSDGTLEMLSFRPTERCSGTAE